MKHFCSRAQLNLFARKFMKPNLLTIKLHQCTHPRVRRGYDYGSQRLMNSIGRCSITHDLRHRYLWTLPMFSRERLDLRRIRLTRLIRSARRRA